LHKSEQIQAAAKTGNLFPFLFDNLVAPQESIMDLRQIIADLREERARLDAALICFENIARRRAHTRGRPPALLQPNVVTEPKKPNRSKKRVQVKLVSDLKE